MAHGVGGGPEAIEVLRAAINDLVDDKRSTPPARTWRLRGRARMIVAVRNWISDSGITVCFDPTVPRLMDGGGEP